MTEKLLQLKTPKFTVEYKGAKFVFKYGTRRDLVEVVSKTFLETIDYIASRLIEVTGLELDGEVAGKDVFLDLPPEVQDEIIGQWVKATQEKALGIKQTKKKRSTKKSAKG